MRRGDLFVLSWESLRRVEWGKVSSFLSMSGGGLFNSLLMGLLLRWSWTIVVWMVFMFRFIVFSSIACVGSGSMFRVYWLLLNIVFFFSRGGWGWVVSLCSGWSGCEAFCRSCELWSLRCFSIGRIFVSSCMWFMLVSEVHPVAILSPWQHHNINNTIASGFNQRIPPARTIAVALDMSKAFDTVNIHTLTKKLLDTQIPPILIKFIANYIKGRKAFTTYNNKTSTQRQFKTGVPQGGVLSPTLFNIYTSDIPSPPPNINITVYADDITMTSTDTNKQIAQAKLQPYLQEIASWTQQNQLHLNPDKTTSTLFTPDPAEYSTQLTLNIDNVVIPTVKNPKILGLTFDPKLTYNSHIRKTSDKARNTLKLLKALTSTKWGKQKKTIVATYKAITRPILEYASTIWSPIASTTGITKLQTIQNMALRIATGCTSDTNIQHLHNETNILPLNAHLKLHSSQLRQKSQHPTHPLHKFTVLTENERHKKQTIFDNNNNYTVNINMKSDLICEDLIQSNLKLIHSHIVSNHLSQRPPNKVLQDQTPSVSPAELLLSRETRSTLAQLRTNKSPLLVSYLFSIGNPRHPSPLFPLCLMQDHTSSHLFECKSLPTSLSSLDLWTNPDKVEPFLATWGERLLATTWIGCWTLLAARWWSGVDNNNNNNVNRFDDSNLEYHVKFSCNNMFLAQLYNKQYNTILYNTILYNTILYNTILYNTILYNTILYNTILYNTILYNHSQAILSLLCKE